MALTRHIAAFAVAALAAIIPAACSNSACLENRTAVPQADFYSGTTNKPVALDSLRISGVGAPADSVLLAPGKAVSSVTLPMPVSSDQVKWAIDYCWKEFEALDLHDTITIGYEPVPHFLSNDCGATFFYRVRSLSHTSCLIDSVIIADSLITNVVRPDFIIYFRTGDTPQEP